MLTALLLALAGLVLVALAALPLGRRGSGATLAHGGALVAAAVFAAVGASALATGGADPVA
uniref:hypothetical protein n=1 Tax=Falsiroseomonas oryziterrae TaxID=2911368 RepID=UPI001F20B429